MKSSSKKAINRNKYHSKVLIKRPNQYSDNLTDPGCQGVNRLFVLSFEFKWPSNTKIYFLLKVEIKDCNALINGQNFFGKPVNI